MRLLQDLARFVRAKGNDDERHEIREYAKERIDALADAFGDEPDALRDTLASTDDDRIGALLLVKTRRAQSKHREGHADARRENAQRSAEVLGSAASWIGGGAFVDVVSLLACTLTHRSDSLVFTADAFTICIPMERLFDVGRLERVDLQAYVDHDGLHIRWGTGGLNLRSQPAGSARTVVVALPKQTSTMAA